MKLVPAFLLLLLSAAQVDLGSAGRTCETLGLTKDFGSCSNDVSGAQPDTDCTAEFPLCVTNHLKLPAAEAKGSCCAKCINSKSGTGRDRGCTNQNPICVYEEGVDGNNTLPRRNEAGMKCVVCLDSKESGRDRGCTKDTPNCNEATNQCES
jgi:hypothetical protein